MWQHPVTEYVQAEVKRHTTGIFRLQTVSVPKTVRYHDPGVSSVILAPFKNVRTCLLTYLLTYRLARANRSDEKELARIESTFRTWQQLTASYWPIFGGGMPTNSGGVTGGGGCRLVVQMTGVSALHCRFRDPIDWSSPREDARATEREEAITWCIGDYLWSLICLDISVTGSIMRLCRPSVYACVRASVRGVVFAISLV